MNWNGIDFYPLMGEALTEKNTMKLDFSPANADLAIVDLSNTNAFNRYVFHQLKDQGKKYGVGGYFEHRAIYRRSEVFATKEADFRNIHLGVDVWTESGTPVFVPLEGKIHSFQDNAGFGDYGATIILEHSIAGEHFYSLYGHLLKSDLDNLQVGKAVQAGELLCHIGPYPENGDWPPHLHFQLMRDMLGKKGDFPGVCSQKEIEKYRAICPDPNRIIQCPLI
ncbi:peptidoglycan DD-metalloendopeptidase family protein [Algoriphagus machipongonensis]|uniref:M23/M37 peptidase/aminotransferase, class III n=1 Tax=Algoriphagus machipongonensis TaxID=388413 RepID=A3HVR0_9BACT|nr:peptidoglycan DD-metalloendopeptidase family protein [Algoriphagus machipongonensis]EAZ82232.1 M23/M37 peptidase/aminotransferase, class III [Algoriphagus machipongonensis]